MLRAMNTSDDDGKSTDRVRGRRVAAVILLLVASAALAETYLPFAWQQGSPLLLGLGFLVWAALARKRGLLVPGGVLAGIGVGALLRPEYGEAAFLFSMAGGFLLIAVLSRVLFVRGCGWTWPLYPAGGLALAAVARLGGPDLWFWLRDALPLWPFLLVAVALYLLLTPPSKAAPDGK
jgi:hypothetical protein